MKPIASQAARRAQAAADAHDKDPALNAAALDAERLHHAARRIKCECDKPGGYVVFIRWPNDKPEVPPLKSCTHTLREFKRRHGKGSFVVVKQ